MAEVGRPYKYENIEDFSKKIDEYFNSCYGIKYKKMRHKEYKESLDREIPPTGYYYEPELDEEGNVVLEQKQPFSITGLCLYLGICRDTLIEYEKRDEFIDTIKEARTKIEKFVEEGSLTGQLNPTVSIFNLKNNFGWKDKTEVDQNIGNKDNKPLNINLSNLTIDQLKELIKDEDKGTD